jgi:hypothetical protein
MTRGSYSRLIIAIPLALYGIFWIGYYFLSIGDYYSLGFKYLVFGALYASAGYLAYIPIRGRAAIPHTWSDKQVTWFCIVTCGLIFLLLPMSNIPIDFFNTPWEDGLPLSFLAIALVTAMNMRLEKRKGYRLIFGCIALSIVGVLAVVAWAVISVIASLP